MGTIVMSWETNKCLLIYVGGAQYPEAPTEYKLFQYLFLFIQTILIVQDTMYNFTFYESNINIEPFIWLNFAGAQKHFILSINPVL